MGDNGINSSHWKLLTIVMTLSIQNVGDLVGVAGEAGPAAVSRDADLVRCEIDIPPECIISLLFCSSALIPCVLLPWLDPRIAGIFRS